MVARLGEQMELLQQTLVNRMPSAANRSIVGVEQYFLSQEPYAPMASEAWSSDMMNRILGPAKAEPATANNIMSKRMSWMLREER
jgi:hypothetical protein